MMNVSHHYNNPMNKKGVLETIILPALMKLGIAVFNSGTCKQFCVISAFYEEFPHKVIYTTQ